MLFGFDQLGMLLVALELYRLQFFTEVSVFRQQPYNCPVEWGNDEPEGLDSLMFFVVDDLGLVVEEKRLF